MRMPTVRKWLPWMAVIGLALLVISAEAQNITNTTAPSTPKKPTPKMTWKAWVSLATCFVVLVVLMSRIVTCLAAMIMSTTFLYLCGIISLKELLAGLSNSGVVTIAMLFICVDPIAELPLVKKLVGKCLGGESGSANWARFKVCVLCLLTSSFLNNAPQVAVLTNLIKNHCREHGMYPSQFLMPMDFAALLGNYAIIGTSTNLIVSGMMEKANLGSMAFFELIKINGPLLPVVLLYLVFAPYLLLPLKGGGLFRLANDVSLTFITRLRVEAGSRLIGSHMKDLHSFLPEEKADVTVVEVERDCERTAPVDPEMIIEQGDFLSIAGSPALLRASAHILGLAWIPANILIASAENEALTKSFARGESNTSFQFNQPGLYPHANLPNTPRVPHPHHSHSNSVAKIHSSSSLDETAASAAHQTPRTPPLITLTSTTEPKEANDTTVVETNEPISDDEPPIPVRKHTEMQRSFASFGAAMHNPRILQTDTHTTLFEAVLSSRCRCIGASVASGEFQHSYNASIVAARRSEDGMDLSRDDLLSYTLATGDVLLVLAQSDWKNVQHETGAFIIINSCEQEDDEFEEHFVQVPQWFPFGHTPTHQSDKIKGKIIAVPRWYPYLVIPIFLAMISCAIAGFDLVICALLACIALVMIGVTTLDRAIAAIDVPLFIMVAFSFGLGAAMDASGFSAFLGYQIQEANVSGLGLLYIVAAVSAVMANLITDKAAVQVVVPLVIAMYKAQGLSPLGGIMCCLCVSTQALCTPWGFSTNLMIMGPGGYSPSDFVKFGVPLNTLGVILIPLLCYGIYYT